MPAPPSDPAADRATDRTSAPPAPDQVAALRAFNRFYTRRIGVLHDETAGTALSLAQTRVLWELAHHTGLSAAALARELDLDPGYLSRLLKGLRQRRLIASAPAPGDARQALLSLSAAGRRAFAPQDRRAQARMGELLTGLPAPGRQRLLEAMATIESLLGGRAERGAPFLLRPHQAGDIGWVISRHGAIYAREYGWNLDFEALVAHIAGRFLERFDARREACWVAERERANVGCVFLVQARDDADAEPLPGVAQLRLLLVEPSARGLGIGERLVAECTRFARQAGYRTIRLWTQRNLVAARAIYAREGYRKTGTERHRSFGHTLAGEMWEMPLDDAAPR